MNLPKITKKQQEIVELLYAYRFLNRIQIQALLHHKNRKTINVWLSDLRDKQYIEWIYSTDFTEKIKPAVYFMGINGVRYLRSIDKYPLNEVRKRYKESGRSPGFISRSIFLAGICITLARESDEDVSYVAETQAQYGLPAAKFSFMNDIAELQPDICYRKLAGTATSTYLVELLDATLPRYRVKRKMKQYVEYLDFNVDDWQRISGGQERPTVLLICPNVTELLFAKRRTRKLLENVPNSQEIHIKFATLEAIQSTGVISKVWEEA